MYFVVNVNVLGKRQLVVNISRKTIEKEIQLSSKKVVLVDPTFLVPNMEPKSREQGKGEEVKKRERGE